MRYLGVDVGRVRRIRIDQRSADRVQVIADIDSSAPICDTTTARAVAAGRDRPAVHRPAAERRPPGNHAAGAERALSGDQHGAVRTSTPSCRQPAGDRRARGGAAGARAGRSSRRRTPRRWRAMIAEPARPPASRCRHHEAGRRAGDGAARAPVPRSRKLRRAACNESMPSLGPKVCDLTDKLDGHGGEPGARQRRRSSRCWPRTAMASPASRRTACRNCERTLREARAAAEQFGELSRSLKRGSVADPLSAAARWSGGATMKSAAATRVRRCSPACPCGWSRLRRAQEQGAGGADLRAAAGGARGRRHGAAAAPVPGLLAVPRPEVQPGLQTPTHRAGAAGQPAGLLRGQPLGRAAAAGDRRAGDCSRCCASGQLRAGHRQRARQRRRATSSCC